MGLIGRMPQRRRSTRIITIAIAVALLLVMAGGSAWALSISKSKHVSVTATYTVTLTPTADLADRGEVSFEVGQATVTSWCEAYFDPSNPSQINVVQVDGITNSGPGPIGVVTPDGITSVPEGESTGGGGEVVNAGNGWGPAGGIFVLGILKERGSSAGGTLAWSARVNLEDGTAICVFSHDMEG